MSYFTETKDRIHFNNWDKWNQELEFCQGILHLDFSVTSLFTIYGEDHFISTWKNWLDTLDPKFQVSGKKVK